VLSCLAILRERFGAANCKRMNDLRRRRARSQDPPRAGNSTVELGIARYLNAWMSTSHMYSVPATGHTPTSAAPPDRQQTRSPRNPGASVWPARCASERKSRSHFVWVQAR
jgi:hypothetical protein